VAPAATRAASAARRSPSCPPRQLPAGTSHAFCARRSGCGRAEVSALCAARHRPIRLRLRFKRSAGPGARRTAGNGPAGGRSGPPRCIWRPQGTEREAAPPLGGRSWPHSRAAPRYDCRTHCCQAGLGACASARARAPAARERGAGGVGPRAGWLRNAAKPTPAALHVLPSSVTCDWPTSSQSLMFAVSASGAPAGAAAAAAAAAAAPAPHVSRLSGRSWVSRARPAREVPAGALQRPRGRAVLVALAGARCGRARSLVAALPNCSRSTSRTQRLATVHPGAMCLLPRLVCTRPALRRCHDSYACSPPKGSAAAASARRLTVKDVRRMPSGARSRAPSACTRRITILGTLGHAGASPSWGP